MRRIAILVAVVVAVLAAVVVVVLPPVFGGIARSFLDDFDGRIPIGQAFGTDAELEVAFHDWEPGWFSSTAGLSLSGGFGGVGLFAAETPVVVTLRHGPLLSGVPSGLGWGSLVWVLDESTVPVARDFYEETGLDAVARLGLLLGFGGGTVIGVDVSDFRFNPPGSHGRGDFVHFGGLEAVADLASDGIDLGGDFGGLRWVDNSGYDGSEGEVGRIALMARLRKDSRRPVPWLGDLGIDGDGLTASVDGQDVEIGRFDWRFGTGVVDDRLDARMEGRVSDVRLPVDDGQLRLDNLVADIGVEVGAYAFAGMVDGAGSSRGLGQLFPLLATADSLLREHFVVRVRRLSFEHEGRSGSTALMVEYRGDELPGYLDAGSIFRMIQSPAQLPISVHLDLDFHRDLPGGLARSFFSSGERAPSRAAELDAEIEAFEAQMRDLAQSGVLEERGPQYTLRAEFNDGELHLNGESIHRLVRRLGGQRSDAARMLRDLAGVL